MVKTRQIDRHSVCETVSERRGGFSPALRAHLPRTAERCRGAQVCTARRSSAGVTGQWTIISECPCRESTAPLREPVRS